MVGFNNYFKSVANVASFGLLKTFDPKSKGHGYIQTLANDTSKVLSPIPDTCKSFIENVSYGFSAVTNAASQLGSDCIGTGRKQDSPFVESYDFSKKEIFNLSNELNTINFSIRNDGDAMHRLCTAVRNTFVLDPTNTLPIAHIKEALYELCPHKSQRAIIDSYF